MSDKKTEEPRFEVALEKLETVVAEMESGQLTLEKSMEKFEEGMKLARLCSLKLHEAERKVEILMRKADAAVEWQPVESPPPGLAVEDTALDLDT